MPQTPHTTYGQPIDDVQRKLWAARLLKQRGCLPAAFDQFADAYHLSQEEDDDLRWRKAQIEARRVARQMEDE